jgi:hypothetical protein
MLVGHPSSGPGQAPNASLQLLFFDLTPDRLLKQRARDGYGSACSGEAPRTGKERKKRLPERLREKETEKAQATGTEKRRRKETQDARTSTRRRGSKPDASYGACGRRTERTPLRVCRKGWLGGRAQG